MLLLAPRVPRSARSSCSLPLLALLLTAGCMERGLPSDPATSEAPLLSVAEPVTLSGETLTAGGVHSCGLSTTGVAYCWGGNYYGQLGDGTMEDRLTPVPVQAPPGVSFAALSAGNGHTCALATTGAAYCWGGNQAGQLGDGTRARSSIPVAVRMPPWASFIAISARMSHTCAVSTTGAAYCWGGNHYGQLGDGTRTDRTTPVPVRRMPPGVSLGTISAGYGHTVALSTTGEAYAWGWNLYGQLGDGTSTHRLTPVAVQAPAGVSFSSISTGHLHSVALSTTGVVYGWGRNADGQLGDGTATDQRVPVAAQLPGGLFIASVGAGDYHTLAAATTGEAYAWGLNTAGQLGDGTGFHRNTPVAVQMPDGVSFLKVSGANEHSVALSTTGAAFAWGRNNHGQLGDGTRLDRWTPVPVHGGIIFE